LAQLSGPTPKPQPAPKLDTIQLDPTQRKILQALPLEQRAQARADMLASAHAIAQARRQMAAANEGEGEAEENEAAGDDGHQPGTVASADTNNGQASEATAPFHIYYYHPDQIGTPRELTNAAGQIVWRAEYLAWGNTLKLHWLTDVAPVEQPLRFQGQYYDEETGLHYNRFRYYDPDLGRFVSQDPIGLRGGINLFEYAPNPLEWIDPMGLSGRKEPTPWIPPGNSKEGWQHIDERHVSGTHASGHGDLFEPGTTQAELEKVCECLVKKGTRISDPNKRMQTYEKRMKVNGRRDRVRGVFDSHDGNRTITVFPVRSE
ncbi:RHS repeat domain-containing protein, partial [Parachitinimonas caeni]